MFVNFTKLKFKNILSYGNNWTELDFHKGLNLIKAQNGSGKSTILDALNFVLFGKPFRDIKIAQLINKYNGKDLAVTVNFKINKDDYEITRGLKPTIFSLKKNGNEVDSLSSKKLNQEEIDKLLGINERLFKNIVGIAVTNNKPFLTMSIGDKRSLIESIFNIDVLSAMAKEVKKRNTFEKSEQRVKITELNGYNNSIADNKNYIVKITDYISQFENSRDTAIKNKESDIEKYKLKIANNDENIQLGTDKVNELKDALIKPDESVMTEIVSAIAVHQANQNRINKTLKELGTAKFCPLCNSELDEGHALEHITQMKSDLETARVSIEQLNKKLNEQKEIKSAYQSTMDFINTIESKIRDEDYNRKNLLNQIKNIEKEIDDLKNKTCDFSTAEYEEKLQELSEKTKILETEINEMTHSIEIDNMLLVILGDEGLRMYFFNRLLPVLNQRINFYLKKFELAMDMEFDAYMNATIRTGKFIQDYNQFSGGEKSRIDMAILLSFFDISKIISNWSCSILFIDEVMDAGVDGSGIEQFLSTLYNIVAENSKQLGIYLISHKLAEVQANWNEVIQIEKKSMFSEIKKGK